jgi:WD40 repeat protein
MSDEVFPDEPLPTRTEAEGLTVDLPEGNGHLVSGSVEGERYEIMEMLGRGGMGEVWRAFDLKLRVEVALKALREDFFQSERRLELLRQEVRAAREVISPNVCRIFDLIEIDGRELVSMEYVDGATLLGVLQERGPLELKEAQDIASQFLAGLEAIHAAGLVHRDVKPENIMLTRAGRVVVMDFGLARQASEGGGSASGTPAYMSPEHGAGDQVDARADVYSAGVVLAEMVSPEGIKSYESRQSLWEGVRSEPARVPDSPWAAVIERAVARDRDRRQNSAHTLIRELEDVTLRVEGAEDLHPYPGLASFTEEDAEYFFGREAEVELMWRKLEGPVRMLALVGPSGAGKTSFLHAGLLPTRRAGWGYLVCTPGGDPRASLRRALVAAFGNDADAIRELAAGGDDSIVDSISGWAKQVDHAVVVVDQFEELFTLNTSDEERRFSGLLGRLVLEADVFVLLSMRDDFLYHCHRHKALQPVLSDLTMLGPPEGAALRRALVQPATTCGYRFEDDELVDDMLTEVEGERGALPMLAFSAARLWEMRDADSGHLTRRAYQDIGGVAGALARHAETTVDRIGIERIPVIRELFRNLVTAEGTRAVREWGELLSVFGESQRPGAEDVLQELIAGRLLTSYETREGDEEPTRSVEIIHESLLANWPRFVRWQTQDQEGAQLRDELRQAARAWDEHDRHDDRLWTGSAFREFQLWRERYPGGLTEVEEDFATAMTMHARRRVRRRRLAVAAAFVVLLAVLAVVGVSRQEAVAQARRAEASKLTVLGRSVLESDRTGALAYAIASLDQYDTSEGRRLAMRALWAGPPSIMLPEGESGFGHAFSPDGSFLAAGYGDGVVRVFPHDGGAPLTFQGFEKQQGWIFPLSFSPDSRLLVAGAPQSGGEVRVWETESGKLVRTLQAPEPAELLVDDEGYSTSYGVVEPDLASVLTVTFRLRDGEQQDGEEELGHWVVRRWPLDEGPSTLVGEVTGTASPYAVLDPDHGHLVVGYGTELHLHRLETLGQEPPRVVGRHEAPFGWASLALGPHGELLAAGDREGNLRFWPLDGDGSSPERELGTVGQLNKPVFSPDGDRLAHSVGRDSSLLWDLRGPSFAEPLSFGTGPCRFHAFTPDGRWLAATQGGHPLERGVIWPLSDRYPRILRVREGSIMVSGYLTRFHPDGSRIYTVVRGDDNVHSLLSWPLTGGVGSPPTVEFRGLSRYALDPLGRYLLVGRDSSIHRIPFVGTEETVFDDARLRGTGPNGRHVALLDSTQVGEISLLDLETGERLSFEAPGEGPVEWWAWFFDSAGRVLVARGGVLSRWDPETDTSEVLIEKGVVQALDLGDGRHLMVRGETSFFAILDPETGSRIPLPMSHRVGWTDFGFDFLGSAVDPSGSGLDLDNILIITGHHDGEVRVGRIGDDEPHLLFGHSMGATKIFPSPDGKWIASIGEEGALYLWPMPDLDAPPFHTLPYDELIARLKAMTNLRAVPDLDVHTGYSLEVDLTAYHGWAEIPEW